MKEKVNFSQFHRGKVKEKARNVSENVSVCDKFRLGWALPFLFGDVLLSVVSK
jgi:hypothetical protein